MLSVLGEYVARGGPGSLLSSPVEPGEDAFPDPWDASRRGVTLLLRRLAWHVGQSRSIVVRDEGLGARPTQRKPETHVELTAIRERGAPVSDAAMKQDEGGTLELTAWFVGEDDVAGTLAHELGVAHAVLARAEQGNPYRAAEPPVLEVDADRNLERGSVATVYLGLGVLAANAAYQQYSGAGRFNGGYAPLEYEVLRAGYAPMSELAYLLAVQATVRGTEKAPEGLSPPQRDEVTVWIEALRGRGEELRDRLGIAAGARGKERPEPEPFEESEGGEDSEDSEERRQKIGFRWQTTRTGEGFLAGFVAGIPLGWLAGSIVATAAVPGVVIASTIVGLWLGRATRIARCSTCATVIARNASECPKCTSTMYGDITQRELRLEAEERVIESGEDLGREPGEHGAGSSGAGASSGAGSSGASSSGASSSGAREDRA